MEEKIGIIGFGSMGSAIAGQLKDNYRILVFDRDSEKTRGFKGGSVASSIRNLVREADAVVLAVKPQDFGSVLAELLPVSGGLLVVSIAAGIPTGMIEKSLKGARVIRAMPNLGVRIGESVTCLSKGSSAGEADLDFAQELFYYLGAVRVIDESLMDAATVVSGSGPGYIFDFMEKNSLEADSLPETVKDSILKRLQGAAEAVGFSSEEAYFLAFNTLNTSINLLKKTKLPAAELKKHVASKGGTTEKGLEVLAAGGSWEEAALAAVKRAGELSRWKR